jgi:predicted esterase
MKAGLAAAATTALCACGLGSGGDDSAVTVPIPEGGDVGQGRLSFRPAPPTDARGRSGRDTVQGSADTAPALAYVPRSVSPRAPMRLVVLLHGAGGTAERGLDLLQAHAEAEALLLLAPQSAGSTWDVLTGGYGPDVQNIEQLLDTISAEYPVQGYTVAGFSDGASYALSLGIANGDIFDSVIAFSPGFQAAAVRNGAPRFYLSHGTEDQVLPIERCSRRLAPALERSGYDVTYEEFVGGHAVPEAIRRSATGWLARR